MDSEITLIFIYTEIEDAEEEDQGNLNQVQPNPSSSELGEIVHAQGEEVLMISINLKLWK